MTLYSKCSPAHFMAAIMKAPWILLHGAGNRPMAEAWDGQDTTRFLASRRHHNSAWQRYNKIS